MRTKEEILKKHIPNGAINLKLVGGGNGKPQYDYEKQVMLEMMEDYGQELLLHNVSNRRELLIVFLKKKCENQNIIEITKDNIENIGYEILKAINCC